MTKEELWTRAVDYTLSHYANRWVERVIRQLIDDCHGDVTLALKQFSRKDERRHSSMAETCGNFGLHWGSIDVECHGSAASTPVSAWMDGGWTKRKADLTITWREIFEYVKAGNTRAVQLDLFTNLQ